MSLDELLEARTIRRTTPSVELVKNALAKAKKDLTVSDLLNQKGEHDWAYTASYTAMLVAARAHMNSQGFRPSTSEGHVAVVKYMKAELSLRSYASRFDRMRRIRHRVLYDEYDLITEQEAKRAYELASEFVEKTQEQTVKD